MSTPTATKAMVAVLAASLIAVPRAAWAADSSEVEELRREVRQLQAQVNGLRQAIAEAAEFDRQRATLLTKALKNLGNGSGSSSELKSEASAARASAPPPPPPPAPPAREAPARRAPAPVSVAAAAPEIGGTVRGKVAIPSGEPVAYVYVENVMAPAVKGQHKVIEQAGKKFVPNWAVVQRGTSIAFPNNDNIYHNVFSLSSGNSFDLGLYNSGGEPKSHTFTEAGPVDVYCNIHPQMAASVLVVPNKYFAKVKADGTFEIPNVPPGRRKVVAWAPSSRPASQWVEVASGSTADTALQLESKAGGHKNKAGQAYGQYE